MSMVLALAVGGVLVSNAQAADKEVTLKGKIMCAKCELKLKGISNCTTCIKVKEGDKEVVYLFLDKGAREEYHEPVCGSGQKEGTVTGTVTEKDGKKWIKPKKVEYAK
jgi:Mrp family chromosome partitioning ATPase